MTDWEMSRIVFSWFSTLKSQARASVIWYWMIHSTSMMFRSPVSMIDSEEKSALEYVETTPDSSVRNPNSSLRILCVGTL